MQRHSPTNAQRFFFLTHPVFVENLRQFTKEHLKHPPVIRQSLFTLYPFTLRGVGSRNRKQTGYLCNLYYCSHIAIVFSTVIGGRGDSKIKLTLKMNQYLCNRTTYECFVCFPMIFKSPDSNSTFILREVVENLRDMAYQICCKVVISKEVCLHYMTPLL